MREAVSVRFRNGSKSYDFDPRGIRLKAGDEVIVQTAQGIEFGICSRNIREIPTEWEYEPLSPVLRRADDADRRVVERNKLREEEAFVIGEEKIMEHGLEMKLVSVYAAFDGNKLTFYFTADGRVDFRALVRDLASVLRCRIELRQIGVRDEARMTGGIGICGRPFCCAEFLTTFMPVSIKMAKTQNLSLNPGKISGACGRLMCCLKYEQNAYEDAARRLPKQDSFVQTPDGPGTVKGVDLLRENVKVSLDTDPEHVKTYAHSEIVLLRNGKGSRDGIELPERPARQKQEEKTEPFPFETDDTWENPPREHASRPRNASVSGGEYPYSPEPETRENPLRENNYPRENYRENYNDYNAASREDYAPRENYGTDPRENDNSRWDAYEEEFASYGEEQSRQRRWRDNSKNRKSNIRFPRGGYDSRAGYDSSNASHQPAGPKQKRDYYDGPKRRTKSWFRNRRKSN